MSENWDFYFTKVDGQIASIFLDVGLREAAPDADRPWLLWIKVDFLEPREEGLPCSHESDALHEIEVALTESISELLHAKLAGRITTDGKRYLYFYSTDFVGFDDATMRGMARFPEYSWESGSKQDLEWKLYLNLLYPTDRDWQRIKNRHVIDQLTKHGDSLTKKRMVFHWAYFADEDSRRQFVAEVQKQGYTVTNQARTEKPDCDFPWGVAFERRDHVDWDSINAVTLELYELANSLQGDYDGWETSVEVDS